MVIDFHLTFGLSGSPGFCGVMSAAAEHAHCNTTLESAHSLSEGVDMMAHVNRVDGWGEGNPTPVPSDAKIRTRGGERSFTPFALRCTWTTNY